MSEAKMPLIDSILRVNALAAATVAGVGFIPVAPGTFGSMIGVLLFFPLAREGLVAYAAAVVMLLALGVWSSSRAEEIFDSRDDGRIVIDELVGQLIALVPLVVYLPDGMRTGVGGRIETTSIESTSFLLLVVTGFVTFRVLDIYKPGVIRWVERSISGGAGVMADDCVAGVFAALVLSVPTAAVLWWGS